MKPKNQNNQLAVRSNKHLDKKKEILKSNEVVENLNKEDLRIATSGIHDPISELQDQMLNANIVNATKFICRDVGIQSWNDAEVMRYDAIKFIEILKRHYSELTIDEVKLAFELSIVGDLDEWLPKDKNGLPDKNHYQAFSLIYITKILNAYKSKKNKVWVKARALMPKISNERELSESEKQQIIESGVVRCFDEYLEIGEIGHGNNHIFDYLEKRNLINKDRDYRKKIWSICKSKRNPIDRKNVSEALNYLENKKHLLETQRKAQSITIYKKALLKGYFDSIINQGKHISDNI